MKENKSLKLVEMLTESWITGDGEMGGRGRKADGWRK